MTIPGVTWHVEWCRTRCSHCCRSIRSEHKRGEGDATRFFFSSLYLRHSSVASPSTAMTQEQPLLSCTNLTAPSFTPTSAPLWTNVTLSLPPSSILALRGPSGCGKTVLLKSLAHLLVYPTDTTPPPRITLSGKTPNEVGIPRWRAKVLYLPQRAALLPGTPNEFFGTLCGVASRKGEEEQKRIGDPKRIANEWGIGEGLWEQKWGELSGGEAQRIALAVALALKPDVLLLDGESALPEHAASARASQD